jgi:hypothetical protein
VQIIEEIRQGLDECETDDSPSPELEDVMTALSKFLEETPEDSPFRSAKVISCGSEEGA